MKVGQKVQAKIKNRWKDVVIKRVFKTSCAVIWGPLGQERVTVKNEFIRKKPRKKATPKAVTKKKVTTKTKRITKTRKTVPKVDTPVVKVVRPGTKANPWIPLADLRSCNAISNLDYETKVKFEAIIISLIKDQ